MGIEPTRPAWKAGILPLNYTRMFNACTFYQSFCFLSNDFYIPEKFFRENLHFDEHKFAFRYFMYYTWIYRWEDIMYVFSQDLLANRRCPSPASKNPVGRTSRL